MIGLRLRRRYLVSSLLSELSNTSRTSKLLFSLKKNLQQHSVPFKTNSKCLFQENDSNKPPYVDASMTAKDLLEEAKIKSENTISEFPSDSLEKDQPTKDLPHLDHSQQKHSFRPKIEPRATTIFLFPGQGSHFVGMGKDLVDVPGVKNLYFTASEILGYDLLDVCINGPAEKLNQTIYSQPAVLVTSLAAVEKQKQISPWAIKHCVSAAGFSVGEYAALAFSGSLSFENAVKLIKVRAEAMQEASVEAPSGMMTVFLTHRTKLNFACHTARRYCVEKLGMDKPVCSIANYLYPECKVIAGHNEALEFIEKYGKEFAISRMKRLPVSGAFHSPLMTPAKLALQEALQEIDLNTPIIPVHCNVSGKRHRSPRLIKQALVQQLVQPVKWEQIMHIIYSRSEDLTFPFSYEMGPGRQLGTILRKVNMKAHAQYEAVSV